MRGADGNVDRFAVTDRDLLAVESHPGSTFNYEPVLCSLRVFLVTESLAWQDLDPLHFETAIFLEHRVSPPRPSIKLPHTRSSLNSNGGTYLRPQKNTKAENEPLCSLCCLWRGLGVGFQRQVDHVVASLNQHERRSGA